MSHPAAPSTPDDRVEPARTFQHYEVLRRADGSAWELGRGTMGITYKAFDVNLCCEVALKVVNAALLDHPNARERFVREARAAAALRHRNVASVYHLGNDGERFFYAMEFIDGETLDALVRRQGPLPVETALRLIEQTARALAAAERQGLVHRDIKPANLMVVHEDADDHMVVKVIDFGLARPVAGEGTSQGALTVGGFMGTPQFASPEQLEEQALDARSDIYSLGVTSWFLLTGHAPFAGSLATICQAHLTKLPPWERLPEGLPDPVRRLLAHMLEKDPARRPQNAVLLRREIDDCLDGALARRKTAGSPTLPPRDAPRRAGGGDAAQTGTVLQGRFELIRLVGEDSRGRVFEGRDVQADRGAVAITILSAELLATPEDGERLGDEVRLIQAAPHPHLTQVVALERGADARESYLIEEWVNGGTLADLLAARGGPLTAGETLRLLGQAAAAADHAAKRRLEHLDLAVHRVCLHFASAGSDNPREHLPVAMADWPAWALKINPLGTIGAHPEMNTWAGEITLVPGMSPMDAREAGKHSPAVLGSAYLHALAALTYELLGGAPETWRKAGDAGGQYVSLPALTEEANAVLRQVSGGKIGFPRSQHFYEALARAAGFDPVNLQVAVGVVARPVASVNAPGTSVPRAADTSRKSLAPRRAPGANVPFFEGDDTRFGVPTDGDLYPEGSIADRLTLVSDDASPVGRWLIGAVALVAVFVLAVAGVWIALAQRLPRDVNQPTAAAKSGSSKVPVRESPRRPADSIRVAVPPPLPRETIRATEPRRDREITNAVPALPAMPTPTVSTTLPEVMDIGPTPPPREKLVSVSVKSIPSGAQISSGGKRLGTTPFEVELPAGPHELIARFDGWPETRETLVLGDDLAKAATEIHLMPPGLVPGGEAPPAPTQSNRPRRAFASPPHPPTVERRAIPVVPAIPVESPMEDASPVASPTPRPEPIVRRALPPLTPFDPDGTLQPEPSTKIPPPEASPAAD